MKPLNSGWGSKRLRLQLRMILHADEPGMVGIFDDLGQDAVRRQAGEAQAGSFQRRAVVDINLKAVAMALLDRRRAAIDLPGQRPLHEAGRIGAEPHGAAQIAAGLAPHELIALRPFGQQADDRRLAGAEFGRGGAGQPREVPRRLDHSHLHAEADAEEGQAAFAREADGLDSCPLCRVRRSHRAPGCHAHPPAAARCPAARRPGCPPIPGARARGG